MMTVDKTGRIVWHDLFTGNRQRAMEFYQRVAGWTYQTEHATDFAWGGGEKDFVLASSGNEAGAGFVETPPRLTTGWVPYIEVRDVDAAAAHAEKLGGTIIRQPFDVPGVGRNALLSDPLGALFGISFSRHGFPAPERQFGIEVYLSGATSFPEDFYSRILEWRFVSPRFRARGDDAIVGPSGKDVAVRLSRELPNGRQAAWIPNLKVLRQRIALRDAENLGATPLGDGMPQPAQLHSSLLRDPTGALFCLQDM